MKKIILSLLLVGLTGAAANAEVKTVTFKTTMHCDNCVERIKKSLKFEKGVKKIDARLADKTVAVTYDDTKTSAEPLQAAIEKLGYKAVPTTDGKPQPAPQQGKH